MTDGNDLLDEANQLADDIIARARSVADELTGQGLAAIEAAQSQAALQAAAQLANQTAEADRLQEDIVRGFYGGQSHG